MKTILNTVLLALILLTSSHFAIGQVSRPVVYKSGNVYHGAFDKFTRPNGFGTMDFPNGDKYEGEWVKGKYHGKGVYIKFTYANGCVYEGDLVNGVPEGEGKKVWPNGATYTGQWHKGAMSGQGEYVFENGARYKGSWANGRYNGEGTYTTSTGKVTHAIYKNGKVEKEIVD